jgi:predicted secreted protein
MPNLPRALLAAILIALPWSIFAADGSGESTVPSQRTPGTLIDFSIDATRSAPNDLAHATAFIEATDAQPGELARRVNAAIAAALAVSKTYPAVKTRSGTSSTAPNYAKSGKTIDSWRMRSELQFESRDITTLSELLGKLQATLSVSQIEVFPAPETRRRVEDEVTEEAIAAFRGKARRIADAMNGNYRIRSMAVGSAYRPPVPGRGRVALMAAEATPLPLEAGESNVSVNISGRIELID